MAAMSTAALACPPNHKHAAAKSAAKTGLDGYTKLASKDGGSGVQISYKIEGTPATGKPLTIRANIASRVDAEVTLSADAGLTLQEPSQVLRLTAGKTSQHAIVVVPQADGRYYLNLFSTAQGRTSASSVAIQVGSSQANLKSSGATQVNPDGQRTKIIQVQ